MLADPINYRLFALAELLHEPDPYSLLDMPAERFQQWLAYMMVKEGSFKPLKTKEEIVQEQVDKCAAIFGG